MFTLKTQAVGCSKTQSVILYIYIILISAVILNLIPHPHNTTYKHNEAQAHMGTAAPKPHLFFCFLWENHFLFLPLWFMLPSSEHNY